MNFTTQSALWLSNMETRKRRPVKPSTLATFRTHVKAHINPAIGHFELETFGNPEMRDFVAGLDKKGLSAKTISDISTAVKKVIKSATDARGERLFHKSWNSEFIDAPVVADQHQPTVTAAQVEAAVKAAREIDAALYVLLAATGLRIGEALALRTNSTGNDDVSRFDRANATVQIRTSLWRRKEQTPKSAAGIRTVELAQPVVKLLEQFAGNRTGFVFGNGSPPSESIFRLRASEHGLPGFHAFRRFRTTVLRTNRVPEEIIDHWLGHARQSGDINSLYSKFGEDVVARREWCDRVGVGFAI